MAMARVAGGSEPRPAVLRIVAVIALAVVLAAAAAWGYGTHLMRRHLTEMPTLALTFWMLVLAMLPLTLGSVLFESHAWRMPSPDGVLTMTMPDGGEWTAGASEVFAELSRVDPKRWRDDQPPIVGNFKATPLMVGGTLYFNTPLPIGAGVDAGTGRTKWVYNPRSYQAGTTTMTLRWNQRGVAYWRDNAGEDERILCRLSYPCGDTGT